MSTNQNAVSDVETVIVGAGISGIGAAIELSREKLGSYLILEQAEDLGGTWRANTYPGVAVDVPSVSYSFSFENDYPWSRAFAPGAEIQDYLSRVAEKYDVRRHIRFETTVVGTAFDPETNLWTTSLDDGSTLRSRYIIACTGLLSVPKRPDIEGLDCFAGPTMHTAEWDNTVELTGCRVGIIGTGASSVQVVPAIAPEVEHLEVFQRTPIWVGPRQDRALEADPAKRDLEGSSFARRLQRYVLETFFEILSFLMVNYTRTKTLMSRIEATQADYIRKVVDDPALHEKLIPKYGFGCKRPATSNTYLQAFNRMNVDLVTESIERITPEGIRTRDGKQHSFDVLILATGFKTMEPGNGPSFDVHGLDGVELGQWWYANRYQAYAGVAVPGFPNLFLTAGPYSGGLNWYSMLEPHLKLISRCMRQAGFKGSARIEVRKRAHERYMADMRSRSKNAVFSDAACVEARSYYLDHHGDASLALARTPWWRWLRNHLGTLSGFRFEGERRVDGKALPPEGIAAP
jgi:cation diffusion facilitator CzcD-associated flavoprotein CzcO